MGDCVHPRSQGYTDDLDRSRCGACGDVWDDDRGMFVPLEGPDGPRGRIVGMEPYVKPLVVVVDIRNGKIRVDGSNLDLPPEGQTAFLESLTRATVIVEVHEDTLYVRHGEDKMIVLLGRTKNAMQLNAEKSDREKAARVATDGEKTTGMTGDRATFDDDPVDKKFKRVWDGSVQSGKPVEGGLKGY